MSTSCLLLVGDNSVGGIMTLSEVPEYHKQIVLYGKNSINGYDVPNGVHNIPAGTKIIVLDGPSMQFQGLEGELLETFKF